MWRWVFINWPWFRLNSLRYENIFTPLPLEWPSPYNTSIRSLPNSVWIDSSISRISFDGCYKKLCSFGTNSCNRLYSSSSFFSRSRISLIRYSYSLLNFSSCTCSYNLSCALRFASISRCICFIIAYFANNYYCSTRAYSYARIRYSRRILSAIYCCLRTFSLYWFKRYCYFWIMSYISSFASTNFGFSFYIGLIIFVWGYSGFFIVLSAINTYSTAFLLGTLLSFYKTIFVSDIICSIFLSDFYTFF